MGNSDNKKNKRSAPIDYQGKGGLGGGPVIGFKVGKRTIFDRTFYGNSYKKQIVRYLTILDSRFLNKNAALYVSSSSNESSRTYKKTKCKECGKISVVPQENGELLCVKCGVVDEDVEHKMVNPSEVSSEENTLSSISLETISYLEKIKDQKMKNLIRRNTKIKVCVLWHLISRKRSTEKKNREFSLDDIIATVPKLGIGKKAAQKQREQKSKSSRDKNEDNEYEQFSSLVLEAFPELKIMKNKPIPIISLIEKMQIQEQFVRRKVEKRARTILDKIFYDKDVRDEQGNIIHYDGDCKIIEFQSKHKDGLVAAALYLVINELRKEDKNINFKYHTQEAFSEKISATVSKKLNPGTIQKNIKDFKKFNLY